MLNKEIIIIIIVVIIIRLTQSHIVLNVIELYKFL